MSSLSGEELVSLSRLSLGQLLALALEHEVIDGVVLGEDQLDGTRVHIYLGSKDLWLEGEEGTTFMRGLIRGYDQATRYSSD